MNSFAEQRALAEIWSVKVTSGKVRYWCSDGQDGGWIDFVTPEESERRDEIKRRAENGDREAANQIDWED